MSGVKRNIEQKINKLLEFFPAVILTGVRQGGKTILSRQLRPEWKYFDLEKGSDYDLITRDFDFFFKENPHSVIIDEAQQSPQLFSELRGVIDSDRNQKGRFILTCSSSLELSKNISESLAGRVAMVEMGTFKLNEFHEKPLSPFYTIFDSALSSSTLDYLKGLTPAISHSEVMDFFLKGGYPEPALARKHEFYLAWMENYFQTYIQRDIRSLFPKLDIERYRRFISMLSSMSGSIINQSHVGRSLTTSEVTVKQYFDIAHGSYLWRNIPSFGNSVRKSIVKMPKGIFRDSGLLHYLQRVLTREQLMVFPHVGQSFESFVIEEIVKGLGARLLTPWNHYYYRTKNGSEVDMIIEGDFGVLPIEIKFGLKTDKSQITPIRKFIKDNDLPLGIVINNSDEVAMIAEGIIQIPAGLI